MMEKNLINALREYSWTMTLNKGRCSLGYCGVQEQWMVIRGFGKSPKNILYQGDNFEIALQTLQLERAIK